MQIVVLGLSITSSWGNGHATTYRGLLRALNDAGHSVLFLERDVSRYASHRDLPEPTFCRTGIYGSLDELQSRYQTAVRTADAVVVGSFVPDGIAVGRWVQKTARGVTAFYDIDTPVTLAALAAGACTYLDPELVRGYALYLSFSGGPVLRRLEQEFGARRARPLYCAVDPAVHRRLPEDAETMDLGYMGTYNEDRQPMLERLLLSPARTWRSGRFLVAGPQYPESVRWPPNVTRREHLVPAEHRAFYSGQRFTLNITRRDMARAGYAPSVRLFEAAACGTPVISDWWEGLGAFFEPGEEILIGRSRDDTLEFLRHMPPAACRNMGEKARRRVMAAHTARHRADELLAFLANAA